MSMTSEVRVLIDAPPLQRRPYGLFSVVPPVAGGNRLSFGVQFKPSLGCTTANSWQDACIQGADDDKVFSDFDCDLIQSTAFMTYVMANASAIDTGLSESNASGSLEAAEEFAVEAHLWAALDAAAVDLGPQPMGNGYVLGLIEGNMAQRYRGRGVIHLAPMAATMLAPYLEVVGGKLVTKACGTPVVVGSGYGDPDSPTQEIIATGGLFIQRGEMSTLTAWDRSINDIHALAEREYLVAWDCLAIKATAQEAP